MDYSFDITLKNRQLLAGIIDKFTLEQLNTIPKGFNNNIIWNIGHSIVTQQLLVYGLSGNEMKISTAMKDAYRKGSKPSGPVSQEEVDQIKELLFSTLDDLKKIITTVCSKSLKNIPCQLQAVPCLKLNMP